MVKYVYRVRRKVWSDDNWVKLEQEKRVIYVRKVI